MTGDELIKQIVRRLKLLERLSVRFRAGEVTATSPLSVALGGSDTPHTSVRVLGAASVKIGDTVAVLTFGNDLLVLGRISSTADGKRTVTGIIGGATGSEDGGDTAEFSVVRTGTGNYTVTFGTAFAAAPAITLTTHSAGANVYAQLVGSPSSTGFSAITRTVSPIAAADSNFHFTAIGPR